MFANFFYTPTAKMAAIRLFHSHGVARSQVFGGASIFNNNDYNYLDKNVISMPD